jgi:hypothetical protein
MDIFCTSVVVLVIILLVRVDKGHLVVSQDVAMPLCGDFACTVLSCLYACMALLYFILYLLDFCCI